MPRARYIDEDTQPAAAASENGRGGISVYWLPPLAAVFIAFLLAAFALNVPNQTSALINSAPVQDANSATTVFAVNNTGHPLPAASPPSLRARCNTGARISCAGQMPPRWIPICWRSSCRSNRAAIRVLSRTPGRRACSRSCPFIFDLGENPFNPDTNATARDELSFPLPAGREWKCTPGPGRLQRRHRRDLTRRMELVRRDQSLCPLWGAHLRRCAQRRCHQCDAGGMVWKIWRQPVPPGQQPVRNFRIAEARRQRLCLSPPGKQPRSFPRVFQQSSSRWKVPGQNLWTFRVCVIFRRGRNAQRYAVDPRQGCRARYRGRSPWPAP